MKLSFSWSKVNNSHVEYEYQDFEQQEFRSKSRGYEQGRKKHRSYIYGTKGLSSKSRRCGECEGCTRDDCGECLACIDKPRFGGPGLRKQACVYRACTNRPIRKKFNIVAEASERFL